MNKVREIIEDNLHKDKKAITILAIITLILVITGSIMLLIWYLSILGYFILVISIIPIFAILFTILLRNIKEKRWEKMNKETVEDKLSENKKQIKLVFLSEKVWSLILIIIGILMVIPGIFIEFYEIIWAGVALFLLIIPGGFILLLSLVPFIFMIVRWYQFKKSISDEEFLFTIQKREKNAKKIIVTTFSLITILIVSSTLLGNYLPDAISNAKKYKSGEIVILNNDDFTDRYNFQGKGTITDPYVINSLSLATDVKDYGIYIEGTTVSFTITNCSFIGFRTSIFLISCSSRVSIIGNNITVGRFNQDTAGYFYREGIYVSDSSNVLIENNNIISNEIQNANRNYYGMTIYTSNVILRNNTCVNFFTGIYLVSAIDFLLINRNNLINNSKGIRIYNSDYQIDELIDYLQIEDNSFINNGVGLTFYITHFVNAMIISNNFTQNKGNGISVEDITEGSLHILNNTFNSNNYGLHFTNPYMYYSYKGEMRYNTFEDNSNYAIKANITTVNFFNFTIYQNNFINNNLEGLAQGQSQVFDSCKCTQWFKPDSFQGNYWSDLIWDDSAVYTIDGSNNNDSYPLEDPVD